MSWDVVDRGVIRVDKGVPQGSPLSPIIFLFYVTGIVSGIVESLRQVLDTRVEVISYVDDLAVVVGETRGNPEVVRQLVKGTVGIQARSSRVEMALDKTEWMMSIGGGMKNVKWLGVDINRGRPLQLLEEEGVQSMRSLPLRQLAGELKQGAVPRSWNLPVMERHDCTHIHVWVGSVVC